MAQVALFGPGTLMITRTDVTLPTPINVGFAQEFSIDESASLKELYGQNKYPLVLASGEVKVTGKIKTAMVSGLALNAAFRGGTFATGQLKMAVAEAGTIPGTSTYTVTVSNSATWETDLGAVYASNQVPFTKVASGPAAGQYSVSAGVYTFAAADASTAVQITYAYTATGGQKQTIANSLIGTNTTFQLDYWTSLVVNGTAKPYYVRLYNCMSSKLAQSFKLSDFSMPEIDIAMSQNAAGNVYQISLPEVS